MNTETKRKTKQTREDPRQAGKQQRDKRQRTDWRTAEIAVVAQRGQTQVDGRHQGKQRGCANR